MKANPQQWQKNQDALLRVRAGTFQAFLYGILAVYIVGYLILAPLMIQSNQISIIVALTGILVVIGVLTFFKMLPLGFRKFGALVIIAGFGLSGFVYPDLIPHSRTALFVFLISSSVLVGIKSGILAGIFSTLVIFGYELFPSGITNPLTGLTIESVARSITFALGALIITVMMAMFSKRINLILIKQIELNHSLEEKSKNFETQIQTQSQGAIKAVGNLATYHMVGSQLMLGGDEKENLRAILETIIANYRFYFCGIFLLDEKNQNLKFLVGSGEVGSILAASNHQVKVSEHGIFTETVSSHNVQAIPDVTTSPSYSPIPIMGATRSQFAFPILSKGQILGLIDLHDDKPRELSPDEQKTLEWIASLIGRNFAYGTLETGYQDSQKELKAIYREMTHKNWQTYFRVKKRKYSIRLSHSGLEKNVSAPPEVGEIINNGQPLFMAAQKTTSSKPSTSIAIPIKLRNEVLGALNVHVDSNKPMQSLVPVLEAAADRLAIALENARLLEEIREKANREHLVSEISAKVRGAINVEQVLKTTAMEISHSLGVSEVVIQLRPPQ